MAKTIEAKVSHRFSASADRVFDAWLDAHSVREWMALPFSALGGRPVDVRRVDIDARVGGRDARWVEYIPQTEQGWSGMLDQIAAMMRAQSDPSA